jgi:hypothetical protein
MAWDDPQTQLANINRQIEKYSCPRRSAPPGWQARVLRELREQREALSREIQYELSDPAPPARGSRVNGVQPQQGVNHGD